MTLPVSGAISINAINVELGVAGTTTASLGQASFRTLAGVASGAISMSNFYGKSNRKTLSYVFSANTANASLNVSAISGYIAGGSDITVTVNSGVYIYATTTGGYALNLTGGTTGDTITLVNNGYIMGQGGAGGQTQGSNAPFSVFAGGVGGPALNIGTGINITINNTNGSAYIGGGGGGGAGCKAYDQSGAGGGGAGGGAGGNFRPVDTFYWRNGGAGGGLGGTGGAGGAGDVTAGYGGYGGSGGGGGRIFPGSGGAGGNTATGAQGGGAGGGGGQGYGNLGANGGAANAAGGTIAYINQVGYAGCAGGGGWGASGGNNNSVSLSGGGGAGGKAVNLNGKSITWVSGNTSRVYGAVS